MSSFSINWITQDNQIVTLDKESVKAVCLTAMAFQSNLILQCRLDKDAILACQSLEELLALPS